jgi:isopentenyl diphosphate isomerase/L-lactate dehydrogenase-like FMN-dependent dehydrogenase
VTLSILRRAKAAGFTALVVTLDVFTLGWRPDDLDAAYLPFIAGVGVQVGTSDPIFMERVGEDGGGGLPLRPDERPAFPLNLDAFRVRLAAGDEQARATFTLSTAWLRQISSGTFRSWPDIAFLRENWDGPIVLKGIQAVNDAHAAMDAHVDGIIVSNHGTSSPVGEYSYHCALRQIDGASRSCSGGAGGRQIDGAAGSFNALEKITASPRVRRAQEQGNFTVLFDSGIRTGSDVIKAIAMGAQGVLGEQEVHRWMFGS